MKTIGTLILLLLLPSLTFAKESESFADKVIEDNQVTGAAAQTLKSILTKSYNTRNIGTEDLKAVQGPNQSWHPASREQCVQEVLDTGIIQQNTKYQEICGAPWMSPVPGADGKIESAKTCIDQFEFPNKPCEYPVVWVPASEAQKICESVGKRACNSHEWEGACSGATDETDPYLFGITNLKSRRNQYNANRKIVWAYQWNPDLAQVEDTREICGVYSEHDPDFADYLLGKASQYFNSIGKSQACHSGSDYKTCGTNTWPAGYKHRCRSKYDVYDLHGNVAEVVNFPRSPSGLAEVGNTDRTERKGSFFVYRSGYPDDCRVRQPYEHFNNYSTDTHSYYQEGFRCCKTIGQ